jgi:hypothetical protein
MDRILFLGADCCSADQFIITAWNFYVYYCVDKSLPLVYTQSQLNLVHISWPYFNTYFSILSSIPSSSKWSFFRRCSYQNPAFISLLLHLCYIVPIALFSFIRSSEWYLWEVQIMKLLFISIFIASCYSLPYLSQYCPHPAIRHPPFHSSCGLRTYMSANCCAHCDVCVIHIVSFTLCTLWGLHCAHCEVYVVHIVMFLLCTLWGLCFTHCEVRCAHCEVRCAHREVCVLHIVRFLLCTLWGLHFALCEVCVVHIARFVLCTLWVLCFAHCEVCVMHTVRFVFCTSWGSCCAHCEVCVVHIVRFVLCTFWGSCCAHFEAYVVTSCSVHSWSWILWCLITILEALVLEHRCSGLFEHWVLQVFESFCKRTRTTLFRTLCLP